MKNNTRKIILEYITSRSNTSVEEINQYMPIKKVMIHRHLKKLIQEEKIYKEGSPPKVSYYALGGLEITHQKRTGFTYLTLKKNGKVITITNKGIDTTIIKNLGINSIDKKVTDILNKEYIPLNKKIKPNTLYNIYAYAIITHSPDINKEFDAYIKSQFPSLKEEEILRFYGVFLTTYQNRTNLPFLDATSKLTSLKPEYKACKEKIVLNTLHYTGLDKVDNHKSSYYQTMESIKEFQERKEIDIFYKKIFNKDFDKLIEYYKIDMILVIPNSVGRKISFNEYIEKKLTKRYANIPFISVSTNIFPGRRPQKKISGICKRIENATKLFDITSPLIYKDVKNILLIDDVLGSGATMNTIASKVKVHIPNASIHGYSILGSYRKGFDVISGI